MILEDQKLMEEWGYIFLEHGFCRGHIHGNHNGNGNHAAHETQTGPGCENASHRLWFTLRDKPTGHHYDPVSARVWIVLPQGGLQRTLLRHPGLLNRELRIGPGHLQLRNQNGRAVDAFTFGGHLHMKQHDNFTCCTLNSPAPIFNLKNPENHAVGAVFCERVDAILACRKARWMKDPQEFFRRLALVSPLDLFRACLKELANPKKHAGKVKSSPEAFFEEVLNAEIHSLSELGLWSEQIPEINTLI